MTSSRDRRVIITFSTVTGTRAPTCRRQPNREEAMRIGAAVLRSGAQMASGALR